VRRAGKGTISLVYYSGHGASDSETQINYLIPIDITSTDESEVWSNSIDLKEIVNRLREQSPDAVHYVIFDACREELRLTREGKKTLEKKGFVPVANIAGVMIAYATAPGKTASDAGNGGGVYAKTLAEEIVKPGVESVMMFRNVQLKVKEAIDQDPWLSFPTMPAVYFAGRAKPDGPGADRQIEIAFWESVKDNRDPAVLAAYLERYPKGEFASTVRALIVQYEQQLWAERTAREEERTRQRAEGSRTTLEMNQQEDQNRAELAASAEQLREALEEIRIAREAAQTAEEQRAAAIRAAEEARSRAKLASLPSAGDETRYPENIADDPVSLARALQTELKRVGCDPGELDGVWGAKAKNALADFARLAKRTLPSDAPSSEALQAVLSQKGRICPDAFEIRQEPRQKAANRPNVRGDSQRAGAAGRAKCHFGFQKRSGSGAGVSAGMICD
jgi:uncharacterized caspase-like protein